MSAQGEGSVVRGEKQRAQGEGSVVRGSNLRLKMSPS
jgi:hypothetical protein